MPASRRKGQAHFKHAENKQLAFREQEFSLHLLHNHSTLLFWLYHSHTVFTRANTTLSYTLTAGSLGQVCTTKWVAVFCQLLQFIGTVFLAFFFFKDLGYQVPPTLAAVLMTLSLSWRPCKDNSLWKSSENTGSLTIRENIVSTKRWLCTH